jgi:hypothetical protein
MPRKLTKEMTLDTFEDEVLFTIASVKADPDAEDLASMTNDWLERIAATRQADLKARSAVVHCDAVRMVANARLDAACIAFGDDLGMAVGWDAASPRWKQFFSLAASRFVRQALHKQVKTVLGWVGSAKDPVLDKHKAALERWAKKADDALSQTASLAIVRGEAAMSRAQLAEDLTADRDGLRDALAARARDRGLPRTWPDVFFRTQSHRFGRDAEPESESPERPPAEPPAPTPTT